MTLFLLLLAALLLATGGLVLRTRRRQVDANGSDDAEWLLHSAARTARRQMNDAAGQSWRNLVE